ncbi:MAG: hypothetical protein IT475_06295 [Aquimonas sp.]|nr:hypothetical protein [Aquimonas sp.]
MVNGFAGGFEADFERFRERGEIGEDDPSLEIELFDDRVQIGSPVRGRVRWHACEAVSVSWRQDGVAAMQPAEMRANGDFSFVVPSHAVVLEVTTQARSLVDGSELHASKRVMVIWPAPTLSARLPLERVERHGRLDLWVESEWVYGISVEMDGRRIFERESAAGRPRLDMQVRLPTAQTGDREATIRAHGLNGEDVSAVVSWEVLARCLTFETRPTRSGAVRFSIRHGENVELLIPEYGKRIPMPEEGVIEHGHVLPVHAALHYTDEAGKPAVLPVRLDFLAVGFATCEQGWHHQL